MDNENTEPILEQLSTIGRGQTGGKVCDRRDMFKSTEKLEWRCNKVIHRKHKTHGIGARSLDWDCSIESTKYKWKFFLRVTTWEIMRPIKLTAKYRQQVQTTKQRILFTSTHLHKWHKLVMMLYSSACINYPRNSKQHKRMAVAAEMGCRYRV